MPHSSACLFSRNMADYSSLASIPAAALVKRVLVAWLDLMFLVLDVTF